MKTLGLIVLLAILVILLVSAKTEERDLNYMAASELFNAACGNQSECIERLDVFRPCFAEAYQLSLMPNQDRVDLTSLVDCLNSLSPVFDEQALRDRRPSFPYF